MWTSRIRRHGVDYVFLHRDEVRTRWSRSALNQFLQTFKGDAFSMRTLRELLARETRVLDSARLSDEEVLERLGQAILSGELVVVIPRAVGGGADDAAAGAAASAWEPPPRRPDLEPQARSPREDEPTFAANHNVRSQIRTLLEAAQAGVPFCEECARASGTGAA